jgi:membrane-bound serine protease (ClpP class)
MTWAILLLGLGLALIVAEVLFPSFGMLGLLATVAIIGAQVFAFREDSGVTFLIVTGLLVPLVIVFGLKILPQSPIGKHLVSDGYAFEDGRAVDARDTSLMGEEGEVLAQLRPAGVARLAGRRVDVVSRGEMIQAGARVRVIELKGNRVVVARAADEAPMEAREGEPS